MFIKRIFQKNKSKSEETNEENLVAPSNKLPPEDIVKVYEEIGQLRNQQFFLATFALTASGLAFLFIDRLTSLASPQAVFQILDWSIHYNDVSLVLGTIMIQSLFTLLFYWSLSLRQSILINSEILKCTGSSQWEVILYGFYEFDKVNGRNIHSQTNLVHQAFRTYGIIIMLGSISSVLVNSELESWNEIPFIPLVLILIVTLVYLRVTQRVRRRFQNIDGEIKKDVRRFLKQKGRLIEDENTL